jgi:predicted Zn-dependent protease
MPTPRKDDRRPRRPPPNRSEGGFGPWGPPRTPPRERRPDEPARPPRPTARYRVTGRPAPSSSAKRAGSDRRRTDRRLRRRPPEDVEREVRGLGGRRGPRLVALLARAADDFDHDRDREALRALRELRDAVPTAASVRELVGLTEYRLGNYHRAAKELGTFIELTGSVEQHPVLMDCFRAQHRWAKVAELWEELSAASPSAELVTEGRIVAAGALADQGELKEAIALLSRKAGSVKRPQAYHLRLWYALADLEERAGNHARARALFARIAVHDPQFADVTAREAALG